MNSSDYRYCKMLHNINHTSLMKTHWCKSFVIHFFISSKFNYILCRDELIQMLKLASVNAHQLFHLFNSKLICENFVWERKLIKKYVTQLLNRFRVLFWLIIEFSQEQPYYIHTISKNKLLMEEVLIENIFSLICLIFDTFIRNIRQFYNGMLRCIPISRSIISRFLIYNNRTGC